MPQRILAIDPSIRALGWAILDLNSSGKIRHVNSGSINQPKRKNLAQAINYCIKQLHKTARIYDYDHLVSEEPEIFGSGKGQAALASGAVSKLTAQVYATLYYFKALYPGKTYVPIKVRQWKGQLPKKVVQRRIEREIGYSSEDHNEMDAVGIALWYAKRLRSDQNDKNGIA